MHETNNLDIGTYDELILGTGCRPYDKSHIRRRGLISRETLLIPGNGTPSRSRNSRCISYMVRPP